MENAESLKEKIVAAGTLPEHVAIIMDGNGRWAQQRSLPRIAGHRAGVESVRQIVRAAAGLDMKVLTLYVFSTENWARPRREVSALMKLLRETTRREVGDLHRNNVRLVSIGRLGDLSALEREILEEGIRLTAENTGLILNLALNYGARDEIVEAVRRLASKARAGELDPKDIDEHVFASHLYTAGLPDPDLLIRTSGELRISNFLLWQIAYAEIYVTEVLWPDFRQEDFYRAIIDFQERERRFGGVSD